MAFPDTYDPDHIYAHTLIGAGVLYYKPGLEIHSKKDLLFGSGGRVETIHQ